MKKQETKILVATHKLYQMPEDEMYIPLQVNCFGNGRFIVNNNDSQRSTISRYAYDDDGINISSKNPYYCELTALYWGWKNLNCDYLGLVHYRRFFTGNGKGNKWKRILSKKEAHDLLQWLARQDIFVILPKKRYYIIETLYSHYAHSHHEEDLRATTQVIHTFFPEYTNAYVEVMQRRSGHMFNMCIMRKDILDRYCTWLFDVLQKVEEILDISQYSVFDKRVFGRLSELLLDVWMTKHTIHYYELPVENLEGEDWLRKVFRFLRRTIKPEHSR